MEATAGGSTASAAACPPAPSRPTDPDFLSCVLQPPTPSSSSSRPDDDYAALRRLLLRRKPPSALQHRMEWRCNGKGYVAYRNFLLRRIDGGAASSCASTSSNSGRWAPSPAYAAFSEADSWSSSKVDFDFSSNNQYIASCSMDKTMRVWEISKGTCIRVVYGVSSQLCICFHPAINFSTGRIVSKLTFDDAVTALDVDHTGQLIFAGDAQVSIDLVCFYC
ncbi:Os01g0776400 [Oryza sativa Japonica Group]|uniref:Os01g0776400 protein n=1 Tax=Oryza sativa subsp. japonica TaxID=39947 RepID=Q0JIV0_ORYSJ|nr:Os01g0776400 [Oryza sativa Japonica Group]|eukprot:NP_001044414.2 Os01g0776400 [Oryza sativa Japonica Group]